MKIFDQLASAMKRMGMLQANMIPAELRSAFFAMASEIDELRADCNQQRLEIDQLKNK